MKYPIVCILPFILMACSPSVNLDTPELLNRLNEGPLLSIHVPTQEYEPGYPAFTLDITGAKLVVDGKVVPTDNKMFEDWIALGHVADELFNLTRIIETTEGNLEFYSDENLVFVISLGLNPALIYSRSQLDIQKAIYDRLGNEGFEITATTLFKAKECKPAAKTLSAEPKCREATFTLEWKVPQPESED